MDARTVYCAACEKEVHLASTPAPLHTGEANLGDEQLICLTYGPRCPPEKCPLANLPSVVMGVRLARSGIPPEQAWRTMSLLCEGCGTVSEVEIVDDSYAFCPVCGTTSRWAEA
jgi:hypothetical protein